MAVIDSKFSNFFDGGDLQIDDIVVGLRNGINTRFSFQGVPNTYLPLAGGTMAGTIDMASNAIINLPAPSAGGDATNKTYVDTAITTALGSYLPLAGGTMTGAIAMGTNKITGLGTPTLSTDAATKAYADLMLPLTGGTMSGVINMGSHKITNVTDPTSAQDAATKAYVDSTGSGTVSSGLINQIAWYAATGTTVSGLATLASGLLVTSAGSVPSISTDIPTAVTIGGAYIYRVGGTDVAVSDGGTGASTLTGLLTGNGTSAFTGTAITQYNILSGGASNLPNSIAPSGTSGVPLISQGAASQPVFGTATVPGGGTGNTTFTAYSLICAGTTATGAFQNVSGVGTLNQVLISQGAGALPIWGSVPGVTPAALTKTDDTNVTMTLGGTPTTALLQATSMTLGWTGQLAVGRGGTGLSAITAHYLPIGNGTSALTLLAPSATSGVPLISQGAAADPAYGTAVVAGGGTGNTTFTAYSVLCAGTTATGAFQNVSGVGTAGQVLSSQGAGALPTWVTIPGATSAALTKGDDTNVTLTLGGSPTMALLTAASITAGWTGQLSLARGGSNANLTADNGAIVYSTASALALLAHTTTAGLALLSGNNAAPTWSTSKPITQINVQVFSGHGTYTYTPTTGTTYAIGEVIGAGAGGGGAQNVATGGTGGGGGGSGNYSRSKLTAAQIGASQTITIGTGGAGGSAGNNAGSNGTDSSIGSLVVGKGGSAGNGAAAGNIGTGGAGGVAGTGDLTVAGQNGGSGINSISNSQVPAGGLGGMGFFGGGAGIQTNTNGTPVTGTTPSGYGCGGNGGVSFANGGNAAGGSGQDGYVIITEYISA